MQNLVDKLLEKAKNFDPRKLSKQQWIKIGAAAFAIYAIILAVNIGVLYSQTKTNGAKVDSLRKTVDIMSLGGRLGSRLLDADLNSHHAIARVGDFYLTQDRFDQLAKSSKTYVLATHRQLSDDSAKLMALQTVNRMLKEQLVGQYAQEHHLQADPADIEARITPNIRRYGSVAKLQIALKNLYNWTLTDFRDEIEFSILRAKTEEALGGIKFADAAKGDLRSTPSPKLTQYAALYAHSHTNYLISSGYKGLAKRLQSL